NGMLGELRDAVRSGLIAKGPYLLLESLDRLSREDARFAVRLLEDICDEGIIVVTLSDGRLYDRSSLNEFGEFLYAYMTAARANDESAQKARRLKAAWENKRSKAATKPLTTIAPAWIRFDT